MLEASSDAGWRFSIITTLYCPAVLDRGTVVHLHPPSSWTPIAMLHPLTRVFVLVFRLYIRFCQHYAPQQTFGTISGVMAIVSLAIAPRVSSGWESTAGTSATAIQDGSVEVMTHPYGR